MPRNTNSCPVSKFLADVSQHQMTTLREDGINRHLRFKRPESGTYWFDIITWPGTLCIDGDMGTYLFKRTEDMFRFFRTDLEYGKTKGEALHINPSYWSEKIQAAPKHKGVTEFDEAIFEATIKDYFKSWVRNHREDTSREERRDLWQSIEFDVLGADGDGGGYRKQCAAHDFHHQVNKEIRFEFHDFWEVNCEAYTYHYIWCCYAIVWAIEQYDTQTLERMRERQAGEGV